MSETPSPHSPPSPEQPGEPAAPQPSTPPPADAAASSTAQQSERSGKGLGIAALIIGIVAFLGFAIPVLNVLSALLAIVGLVLGILALRKASAKGVPLSGVILSGLALLLSVIFIVVYAVGFGAALNEAQNGSSVVDEEPAEDVVAEDEAVEQEPEPVEPDVGTRDNPAPLGTTVEIVEYGDPVYEVVLGPATLDAADAVAEANMFNEPAPEGFQYALLPVNVTYVGAESGTPWVDLSIEFVSSAGTTHTEADVMAVAPEPTFMSINELYPGGTGTGNVVIAIPTDDAENGTWTISPRFGDPFFLTAQ